MKISTQNRIHFMDLFNKSVEISLTFLRAKLVGEKRGEIQNSVKIAHKAVVLIRFFL